MTGPNLSSYQVLQEQSAFLAGVLAARMTKTGTVGHMSGIRVKPGLKGRAAYANGVRYANPEVKLLTNFSGNQDDNALSHRVATAMIGGGADIIFTMLNAGRAGAVEACREHGAKQIGNVVDWTKVAPDVFVASAYADSGMAVYDAVSDFAKGVFKPGLVRSIGVETPKAVRLTMGADVPEALRAEIADLTAKMASGEIEVSTAWDGTEFVTPG